ncbi:hypothetical protein M409DRAFT_18101 [Zasmidium cellare ATCC 36951]|uniref:Xaa-Pro dipeptidyl-peptidase C-terminal domain-containing protein n=1 Tax=Zasmidium cellare ATCC 36951 TaxID=1080233 RepID=A0A6A6D191_ZASCE|nr:uncharacterized protein M409DRAFT_18101 [Zasmidium cellare ATCC 36951]KAF2171869.1 hypothetical protein M409DRAFT_18101 [Zasmidium cellare ATCC 36951]
MASTTSQDTRPLGWSDRSYYLAMRDGVRLALSIYSPDHTISTSPRPVVLVLTRYGRAAVKTRSGPRSIDHWLTGGYVACVVDVRGTTSSFGARRDELGLEEQADAEEIIAHIAAQTWCDGKVIVYGTSYSGNTADLATTRNAPALVAAIPCATDFNWWELFWPGGIANDAFFRAWAHTVYDIDFGRPFVYEGVTRASDEAGQSVSLDGRTRAEDSLKLFPTLQPVDEDADCSLLQMALQSREDGGRHWTADDYAAVLYRDDRGTNGHCYFESSAASQIPGVIRQGKPVQWWASWTDGNTADEGISRFLSTPDIPSVIIITANNHGGLELVDPFSPGQTDPTPSVVHQTQDQIRFAEEILNGRSPPRSIKYYVLGSGIFRESTTWPPVDAENSCFWLSEINQLVLDHPVAGVDSYLVDSTATAGTQSRWNQSVNTSYGDRRLQDEKLLCYETAPMDSDVEIVGWPTLMLQMSAQTEDPVVFAYLEDVSPRGKVTYITEGIIRLIHRKIAPADALPFVQGPFPHTFCREDAMPVVPGSEMTVSLRLFATAALIRKRHRLRLAIAGADVDTFRPTVSASKEERFDIRRGGPDASKLCIPLRRNLDT